jgi:hypothetical protein
MDINQEIIKRIHEKFPSLKITIYPDEIDGEDIIVAIDDDIYYDEEYLDLVMDIKMNLLWPNNIFNYLFVQEELKPMFVPIVLDNIQIPASPLSSYNNTAAETICYLKTGYSENSSEGDQLWPMVA